MTQDPPAIAPLVHFKLLMAGVLPVQHWRFAVLLGVSPVEQPLFWAQGPLVQFL